jgi:hypothetical protein
MSKTFEKDLTTYLEALRVEFEGINNTLEAMPL